MANPTGPSNDPALLEAVSTETRSYALDKGREYLIEHTGLQDDGSTADVNPIFFNFGGGTLTASYEEGANKGVLAAGKLRVIGPGVSLIQFKTAAGEPIMQIIPLRRREPSV